MTAPMVIDFEHGTAVGMSPVVAAFLRPLGIVCDDALAAFLRQSCALDATDLAKGITLALGAFVPVEAPGGELVGRAIEYCLDAEAARSLSHGLRDPDGVLAAHAASLAGEGLLAASRENRRAKVGEPTNPCTVLEAAYAYARARSGADG